MTREQAKQLVTIPSSSHRMERYIISIDKVFDYIENRTCESCKWYHGEVCTNDKSPLCCDFVNKDFGCNLHE